MWGAFAWLRAILPLFSPCLLAFSPILGQQELGLKNAIPPSTVVAHVGSTAIRYDEIRMKEPKLLEKFRFAFDREPQKPLTPEDEKAIDKIRYSWESKKLSSRIATIVAKSQIDRFHLSMSEEEIVKARRESLRRIRQTEEGFVDAMIRQAEARIGLATGEMTEEEAYDHIKETIPSMSFDRWLGQVSFPKSEDELETQRRALSRLREQGIEGFDWEISVGWPLLMEKLEAEIDREIAADDPEYAEYLEARRQGDRSVEERNPFLQLRKLAQWWCERYQEANIRTEVAGFSDLQLEKAHDACVAF